MTVTPPIPPPLTDAPESSSAYESEPTQPRAWGFWLTVAFGVCIFTCYVVPQLAVAMVAGFLDGTIANPHAFGISALNGMVVGIGILVASPVAIGFCVLFAWLRRSMPVGEYLGLKKVSWKTHVAGVGAIILFNIVFASLSIALKRPEMSETMLEIYRTAAFPPVLWAAMVIGAPVAEEVFFRGFLFKGFEQSPVGGIGAVILSSLAWAFIHGQYDAYDMGVIFAMGLLLGTFRWKTGSLLPALVMHILNNLAATVQIWLILARDNGLSVLP